MAISAPARNNSTGRIQKLASGSCGVASASGSAATIVATIAVEASPRKSTPTTASTPTTTASTMRPARNRDCHDSGIGHLATQGWIAAIMARPAIRAKTSGASPKRKVGLV